MKKYGFTRSSDAEPKRQANTIYGKTEKDIPGNYTDCGDFTGLHDDIFMARIEKKQEKDNALTYGNAARIVMKEVLADRKHLEGLSERSVLKNKTYSDMNEKEKDLYLDYLAKERSNDKSITYADALKEITIESYKNAERR